MLGKEALIVLETIINGCADNKFKIVGKEELFDRIKKPHTIAKVELIKYIKELSRGGCISFKYEDDNEICLAVTEKGREDLLDCKNAELEKIAKAERERLAKIEAERLAALERERIEQERLANEARIKLALEIQQSYEAEVAAAAIKQASFILKADAQNATNIARENLVGFSNNHNAGNAEGQCVNYEKTISGEPSLIKSKRKGTKNKMTAQLVTVKRVGLRTFFGSFFGVILGVATVIGVWILLKHFGINLAQYL